MDLTAAEEAYWLDLQIAVANAERAVDALRAVYWLSSVPRVGRRP